MPCWGQSTRNWGQYPAAAIIKSDAREKPLAEIVDQTLILTNPTEKARKAVAQMEHEVGELLADKYPSKRRPSFQAADHWHLTHDYPITFERACELGPYPQPVRRQPSVKYFPVR
jgi:hypothetical protein